MVYVYYNLSLFDFYLRRNLIQIAVLPVLPFDFLYLCVNRANVVVECVKTLALLAHAGVYIS